MQAQSLLIYAFVHERQSKRAQGWILQEHYKVGGAQPPLKV